jgi:hypothetical protein
VTRNLAQLEPTEETGERFATALLVGVPEDDSVSRIISCGHPPPLLLSSDSAVTVPVHPAPPLGIGDLTPSTYTVDVFSFEPGDTLLLYTDGVIETRDVSGAFYPLAERAGQWAGQSPEKLVHFLRRDLLAAISEGLSMTIRPTPRRSAVSRSRGDLALPRSTIRSAGNPVVTASSSSPAEQTSRPRPSSSIQWAMARHRNALAAYTISASGKASR